jgi:hypothetical protein
VVFLSHRSFYHKKNMDNVSIHKLMYQLAWGDVGTLSVTRIFPDRETINPLHLASPWNRFAYPKEIHPMETKFDYSKLLQTYHVPLPSLMAVMYRNTIQHPLEVPEELPEYHHDE